MSVVNIGMKDRAKIVLEQHGDDDEFCEAVLVLARERSRKLLIEGVASILFNKIPWEVNNALRYESDREDLSRTMASILIKPDVLDEVAKRMGLRVVPIDGSL